MGNGVGFEEPWAGFVPLVRFDGDMFSQEGPGFGGSFSSLFILDSDGVKESVYRSGRDGQEGFGDLWGEIPKGLDITWEPKR